jgi:hypothetical protein
MSKHVSDFLALGRRDEVILRTLWRIAEAKTLDGYGKYHR